MAGRSLCRLVVLALTGALAVAGCGSSDGDAGDKNAGAGDQTAASKLTGEPVKIGSVGTFSGHGASYVTWGRQALVAWAKYINDNGGINGHPVELISKDDMGDATKALAAVKELIEDEKVVALVGLQEAGRESAWADVVAKAKVPVIGGAATGAEWMTHPNFFPTAANGVNTLTLTMYAAKLAGKEKYGIIYCAEKPACAQANAVSEAASKKLGVNYVGAVAVSASAPNYTAQCLTLKNKDAQLVFTATSIETNKRFISDCARQGYKPAFVDNPANWSSKETKDPVWDGTWVGGDLATWDRDSDLMKAYRDAMTKYAPDANVANGTATQSWVAGMTFLRAVKASGVTGAPTSADVFAGLYKLGPNFDLDGNIPPVTYTEGKPAVQKPCAWFGLVKDGELTYPKGKDMICLDG